ncbi:hypothetical protein E2C01_039003 [Portunus trituberculatus]|uniref:Uncharacterized protein n=1 Tax=Portunus trituberculatus TaxID=210409 RepID=A0A5B7FIE5_PORTR|nr:hypothetical protein [Portunus trituberculatus]
MFSVSVGVRSDSQHSVSLEKSTMNRKWERKRALKPYDVTHLSTASLAGLSPPRSPPSSMAMYTAKAAKERMPRVVFKMG